MTGTTEVTMSAAAREPDPPPIVLWFLIPAAVGFAAGFFGPLIFSPEANQGPLLGIFITGPGGAVAGLAAGLLVRLLRLRPTRQWQGLTATCALLLIGSLLMSLPGPRITGYVIDGEIVRCTPPARAIDRALEHWEQVAGANARPGWQADALRSAASDPGVVLEIQVERRIGIYEHRKPWNRGRITTRVLSEANKARRYYARYAGGSCEAYPAGIRSRYFSAAAVVPGGGPREWPPTSDVAAFLGLSLVVPVPEEIRRRIEGSGGR